MFKNTQCTKAVHGNPRYTVGVFVAIDRQWLNKIKSSISLLCTFLIIHVNPNIDF